MIASDDHVVGILPGIGWVLLRLFCVVLGAKIIEAIYRPATNKNGEDVPTFATHWRKNARDAIFGVAALGLLVYVFWGGNITISGIGVVIGSVFLILFVTGETILSHREETVDVIESLPGPFILKVVVGIVAFLIAAGLSVHYIAFALRSEW